MTAVSRRDFARLLALSGSTAFWPNALPSPRGDWLRDLGLTDAPLPKTPADPDERRLLLLQLIPIGGLGVRDVPHLRLRCRR